MPESSDFELFNAPAASEKKEVNDEVFQEEMRRTQKAVKDLKKEEGQAKANDDNLAQIIVQFLGQEGNTDLFLLISRTVAQNIPSELIIAILSLIDQRSYDETRGLLSSGEKPTEEKAMTVHKKADFESLTLEQKRAIDDWIQSISKVCHKKPHRVLETAIIPGETRVISPTLIQLASFIMRRYFDYYKLAIDFQLIRDFMEGVFAEILKNLELMIKEQKKLN